MTPPPASPDPELLFRKPGTVTAAQVFMWLQFSFLVCCGTGWSLILLLGAGLVSRVGLPEQFEGEEDQVFGLIAIFVAVFVAVAILYGVLAAKIGAGRRWAQVATIAIMLLVFVGGFVTTVSELQSESGDGIQLLALAWLAMPVATLIFLCTGSANQWFRQRGHEPWRQYWMNRRPYPPPPY